MNQLKRITHALNFAALKHRDQRRKDHAASPYINHPIAIMDILVNEADIYDTDVLVSAILHDTVEDTDTTPEEIEKHFGLKIRKIVEEVTDDCKLPRDERKLLQIKHASKLSKEASLVKIADKIANLRDLNSAPPLNWTLERRNDYRSWAEQVVANISDPHPKLLALFEQSLEK